MKSPAKLTQAFRSRGLKVTPQRQCIFRILHLSGAHPTAEAVFEQARAEMPTISLRTVYQTLNDLADMGELSQLTLGTGSSRFDPNLDPHHHLVCTRCGKVADVAADSSRVPVPADVEQGFQVRATEIIFRGICASCAGNTEPVAATTS